MPVRSKNKIKPVKNTFFLISRLLLGPFDGTITWVVRHNNNRNN